VTDLELPDDHQVFSLGVFVTAAAYRYPFIYSRYGVTYGLALKQSTTWHLKGVKT